jgi:hypothetical protein
MNQSKILKILGVFLIVIFIAMIGLMLAAQPSRQTSSNEEFMPVIIAVIGLAAINCFTIVSNLPTWIKAAFVLPLVVFIISIAPVASVILFGLPLSLIPTSLSKEVEMGFWVVPSIAGIIVLLVFYSIIGAIIGLLVPKIKSKV